MSSPNLREKLKTVIGVAKYQPFLTTLIIFLSLVAAILEGIGLGFVLPIIQISQGTAQETGGIMRIFVSIYKFVNIPLNLETVVVGVSLVIGVRYLASFITAWLSARLTANYVSDLRIKAFGNALSASVTYFDQNGSDEIENAIITQTDNAGKAINKLVRIVQRTLICLAYFALAMYIAPVLTIITSLFFGGSIWIIRSVLESGYQVGERVAEANERVHSSVQSGIHGIRDVKLFGMADKLYDDFLKSMEDWKTVIVTQNRNQAAIRRFNQFMTAISIFVLLYLGLRVFNLSLGNLGVFLFAMFRLGPKVSSLNNLVYRLENDLPHLVRTENFTNKLHLHKETSDGELSDVPEIVQTITFDDVLFSYPTLSDETVLHDFSIEISRGEFLGIVGSSGAGKSSVVALLSRMYEPTDGEIRANGTPIHDMQIAEWRSRLSVVRQDPYIFNMSLADNIKIGNRDASHEQVERVASIALVTEFLDELPNGFDTILGEEGVMLSGGQRQRVAIARALLKDAEILVLDEATSDLDTHLEKRVHKKIEAREGNYTIIAIAHRLSTITNADRICVVENGEIVESGRHSELIDTEGKYADLYSMQVENINY